MLHLVAFTKSFSAAATLTQLTALPEQVLPITAGNFLPDKPFSILGAYFLGAHMTAAQLNVPSYRDLGLPFFHPLEVASAVPNRPNWIDLRTRPYMVRTSEPLGINISTTAAVAEQEYGFLLLCPDQINPPPAGRADSIQFTASITATANAWTVGQLTPSQNLPPGTYYVVGMQVQSATGIAARLVFPNQVARPGLLATTGFGNIGILGEKPGELGVFGVFNTVTYPQLEILCSAADTAQTVILDVVYVPQLVQLGP